MPNNNIKYRSAHHKGSVLVLMLIAIILTFIIGSSLMKMGEQVKISAFQEVQSSHAQAAADSGLQTAVQEINNTVEDGNWSKYVLPSGDNIQHPFSEATYSYKTTYSMSDGYFIESVGTCQDLTHTVRATLCKKGLFEYGIVSHTFLDVNAGAILDAYNSNISNNPEDCSEKIVIGSIGEQNDFIKLFSDVLVDGDIFYSSNMKGSYNILNYGATINGNIYEITPKPSYPVLSAPVLSDRGTSIAFSRTEKTIGAGGDFPAFGKYEYLNLGTSSTLRVIDDCIIHITSGVIMGAKTTILIENGASLTIYVDGHWRSGTDCDIANLSGDPSRLRIIQTSDLLKTISIQAKNDFSGVIYAPRGHTEISAGGDVRGAAVVYSFKLRNSSRFLFDVALKNLSLGNASLYTIDRWDED